MKTTEIVSRVEELIGDPLAQVTCFELETADNVYRVNGGFVQFRPKSRTWYSFGIPADEFVREARKHKL